MCAFQSLIGRLKTRPESPSRAHPSVFQSLIGRLKTVRYYTTEIILKEFQSLIGRLKTAQPDVDSRRADACFNPS